MHVNALEKHKISSIYNLSLVIEVRLKMNRYIALIFDKLGFKSMKWLKKSEKNRHPLHLHY